MSDTLFSGYVFDTDVRLLPLPKCTSTADGVYDDHAITFIGEHPAAKPVNDAYDITV